MKPAKITTQYSRAESDKNRFLSLHISSKIDINQKRYNSKRPEIFVHDYCRKRGAYVPRVWWTDINNTDTVTLNGTVREVNNSDLYDWFEKYGHEFGWIESDITTAQKLVNHGCLAVLIDKTKSTVIIPESDSMRSVGARGITIYPVQAGIMWNEFNGKWWDRIRELKCYVWDEVIE